MANLKSKMLVVFVLLTFCIAASPLKADVQRALDAAIDQACSAISESLKNTNLPNIKNIAVMPLWGQDSDGYIIDTLKSRVTGLQYSLIVRSDPEWDRLLGEIKWNTLREDVMNPQTVQGFGKIEGCDAILYGTVRERSADVWKMKAVVRMTLHMADVETGKLVWSSGPVISTVWLEWPEILQIIVRHPVSWVVAGFIVLLIIWKIFTGMLGKAVRPR